MTISDESIFDYIVIKNDEYIVKENISENIKNKIIDMISDFKKLYKYDLKINLN